MVMPVAIIGGNSPKTFRRARLRLNGLDFAVARWSIRHQSVEQMLDEMCDFVDRAIERLFISVRWLAEATKLSNKLQRRRSDLLIGRWRAEVMQGFDVSAHD
jgi:hypothetical protein